MTKIDRSRIGFILTTLVLSLGLLLLVSAVFGSADVARANKQTDATGPSAMQTSSQAYLVKDINPGAASSGPIEGIQYNNAMFFRADDAGHGYELWRTDGTDVGTYLVKDINPGNPSSMPMNLFPFGSYLYFIADDSTGIKMWKSDGTTIGTAKFSSLNFDCNWAYCPSFVAFQGRMYFAASDSADNYELWVSDGTIPGTHLIKDINPTQSSYPDNLTVAGNQLFFVANDGTHGMELWKSDGTYTGTVMVRDISQGASGIDYSFSQSLTAGGNRVFFEATDWNGITTQYGEELWVSDGTYTGTYMVRDILPGGNSSSIYNPIYVNGNLFFNASDSIGGGAIYNSELWKSDGTYTGTIKIKEICPGECGSSPAQLTEFNGAIYFKALDGNSGVELWKSDGSEAGTVLVRDIRPGSASSDPNSLRVVKDTLYFSAEAATHGTELWQTDGTTAGTMMSDDINPTGSSFPYILGTINNQILLRANDGTHGEEIWGLTYSPQFDLALTQSVFPASPVLRGGPITFTLSFTAAGSLATNVIITDIIPAYVLTTTVSSQGVVITNTGGTPYSWQVENLSPGESGKIIIRGTVSPALYRDFTFTNNATIYSSLEGSSRQNNSVTTTIVIANAPPVAVDDTITIPVNSYILMSYQGNDYDPDPNDHMLTITAVGAALHGTTIISSTGGVVIYTPDLNFNGFDTFTYTISDYHGGYDTGTVHITVNNAPVANDDIAVTFKNTVATIQPLANDVDINDITLSISSVSTAMHGTVVIQGLALIYTPEKDFIGTDSFTYTISDGFGGTDSAIVTVTVQAPIFKVYLPIIKR
jgi:ELWxxDGT repeat protein